MKPRLRFTFFYVFYVSNGSLYRFSFAMNEWFISRAILARLCEVNIAHVSSRTNQTDIKRYLENGLARKLKDNNNVNKSYRDRKGRYCLIVSM